ncbi:MAG: ion channel activity [Stictis urceolatum]|nr:ion channel activity [Stictis urceolata]
MFDKRAGNDALNVNNGVGGRADLKISTHGSDWYWAVCAVMAVSTFVFMGLAFTKPRSHRLFHYITAAITLVASIAYFSMAADLGQTPIAAEFIRPGNSHVRAAGTREIFYVRYIDWVVTTPLLLLDLLLTAGLPWPSILITILIDEVMIITGLVGALTRTSYKWGYFAFGNAAFLYVIYMLAGVGRKNAHALGDNIYKTFMACGVLTVGIWFLYPIAWGISEGGNLIHPDSEAVFYGILDLIAKPVFGAMLLFGHRNIDPSALGLHIHDTDDVHGRTNGNHPHSEKNGHTNGHNGVTNDVPATTV